MSTFRFGEELNERLKEQFPDNETIRVGYLTGLISSMFRIVERLDPKEAELIRRAHLEGDAE